MNVPQFSAIVPCFSVADVGSTMRWYQENFGFLSDPFPVTEPHVFAILSRYNVEIMLQRIEGYEKPDLYQRRDGGVWDAYIRVEGVKELFESVKDKITIIKPLRRQPYGAWEFEMRDPNGYVLVLSGTAEEV
jgi:uncharacterized glyoxalase superfamily protein PhnB